MAVRAPLQRLSDRERKNKLVQTGQSDRASSVQLVHKRQAKTPAGHNSQGGQRPGPLHHQPQVQRGQAPLALRRPQSQHRQPCATQVQPHFKILRAVQRQSVCCRRRAQPAHTSQRLHQPQVRPTTTATAAAAHSRRFAQRGGGTRPQDQASQPKDHPQLHRTAAKHAQTTQSATACTAKHSAATTSSGLSDTGTTATSAAAAAGERESQRRTHGQSQAAGRCGRQSVGGRAEEPQLKLKNEFL